VNNKEQAIRGKLIATSIGLSFGAKCKWCNEFGDKHTTTYVITKEELEDCHVPQGFICSRCACTAEQALVLWGEDGTLF